MKENNYLGNIYSSGGPSLLGACSMNACMVDSGSCNFNACGNNTSACNFHGCWTDAKNYIEIKD
ncbi:MAG: hypothetical protein E7K67_01070 [Peptostreptococcaceae bacterium]|nr:hypothetical protein [Peptostreptococcaceae bacterium]